MRFNGRRRVVPLALALPIALFAACGSFKGADENAPAGSGATEAGAADASRDAGGTVQADGAGPIPKPEGGSVGFKTVFVTSQTFAPGSFAFSSVSDADDLCSTWALGGTATPPGNYKAWISSKSTQPTDAFGKSTQPYKLVDGTVVAANFTALVTGGASGAISLDEDGQPVDGYAWTATKSDGTYAGMGDCTGWTVGTAALQGFVGSTTDALAWTQDPTGTTVGCDEPQHLYCFEQ